MVEVRDGRLFLNEQPYLSIGFNYHPSDTGCQYWHKWNAAQVEKDLSRMSELGFNTVRFFVFWADVEPLAGKFNEEVLGRVRDFVDIADNCDLQCIPSLLTIWMNGQLFDLPWRDGRDLWTDPWLRQHELTYVARIAQELRTAQNVLAFDLGDEVIHVDITRATLLSASAVSDWHATLANAIREICPGVLVTQGSEPSSLFGDHQFSPENFDRLDLQAIHGYPIWSPLNIESNASYKASTYVPFLVKYTRPWGPVLVDEFGCYGADEEVSAQYVLAAGQSVLANGASGIIGWCWQDFLAQEKPYDVRPNERTVGFVDSFGNAKPVLEAFQRCAQQAWDDIAEFTLPPSPIGVYLSESSSSGLSHPGIRERRATSAYYAYILLTRAHLPFEFTRGPLERFELVMCPSVEALTLHERNLLADYVRSGGCLYYSTADYLNGFGGEDLFGISLRDFTLSMEEVEQFEVNGQVYPLLWPDRSSHLTQYPVLAATRAEVLARFPNGTPALTRCRYGNGTAFYLNAPFELQLNAPYRLLQTPWHLLYDHLAHVAGIEREVYVDAPELELITLHRDRSRHTVVINHSAEPVEASLILGYNQVGARPIALRGKGVETHRWTIDLSESNSAEVTRNGQP